MARTARNLWMLTVLSLLTLKGMHPYEMQRRIREWKKDEFLDLKRGSLYQAISRLLAMQLIEVKEVKREGRRPERTVYEITEHGREDLTAWMRELIANPVHPSKEFFAALSFIWVLTPSDAADLMAHRTDQLDSLIKQTQQGLEQLMPRIGRLALIEVEYQNATRIAELNRLRAVTADILAGKFTWDFEEIRRIVT